MTLLSSRARSAHVVRIVALAALAATLPSLATPVTAQNGPSPFDVEQRRVAAEASRLGRSPEAVLALLELWRNWDFASRGVTTEQLERLARDRRLSAPARVYAGTLLGRARLRGGDPTGATREFNELGFVNRWRVVGPFDNEGKRGFDVESPAEAHRAEPPDMQAEFPGKERQVRWRVFPDVAKYGYVSFDAVFRPDQNVCGIADTVVQVERARPLTLWVGAGGAVKVWWNGEQVVSDAAYRFPDPDRSVAVVGAHAGPNRIMVKACVTSTTWGFFLRVGEADGSPARGVRVDASSAARTRAGHEAGRRPTAPATPLAAFEAAAHGDAASAAALERLARFLAYTGADDPAERRAKQLAARAAEREATVDRCKLAAATATERAEAMRFAERATQIAPRDPDAILLRASVKRGGPSPEDALAILDELPAGSRQAIQGTLLRAQILRELGLGETARRVLADASRRAPTAPGFLLARADIADAISRRDEGITLRREALAGRFDDIGTRRTLVGDALARGESAVVAEHLTAIRAIAPDSTSTLAYIAQTYDALGRDADVLATFRDAIALAPEDAPTLVEYGRALLRGRQNQAATDAFRRALAIRPQDAETRELLEQIRPERRVDEAYAVAGRRILERRTAHAQYPITVLQDLTVNTVFENGLGSSFHQMAVQVHDTEGARRWRTYSIQYDPETQRIDVRLARIYRRDGSQLEATQSFEQQLGEPWYRIYYDTRALVLVFPDLEPGDTVELRYRIDDVAHRNRFADYYGDLHILQSFDPVKHLEYVLITPTSREFYFNDPRFARLHHTRQARGGRRIDRFVADDVPAIRPEERMPGITEIAPYLHVSTYRTWQDVGRWWWGLIRDQLYADDSLKRTVAELVRGARDTRTKVQRIQQWVVRHTRYVALEFGIHGFMPYRVPDIVQRGFGDCKDKASLLYTMLREGGVDARIVLVRTRRNGAISDLPASLSVFDHAIAYVPELDLYLDGTAEHSGTTELPGADQGVSVLVVGPSSAELRRTPVHDASRNRRTRQLSAQLATDGSATIDVREQVTGVEAAGYRDYYQAEGTRAERFERALAGLFPGLDLVEQRFESLDDLEQPIRMTYRARVPQLGRRSGDSLLVAPSVMDDLIRSLAPAPGRRHPLDLGATASYSEERTLRLPAGMQATTLPRAGEARSEFGRLSLSVQADGRQIVARTEFQLSRDRVAPAQYGAFRRWVEQADGLLRQRITLGRGTDR